MRRMMHSLAVAIGVAILAAMALALVDLYATGHGYGSLTREILTWDAAGVHLSVSDLILLVASVSAASVTWHRTRQIF